MDTVGRKVRMLRTLKGWSQTKLAEEIGVGQDTISAIERGEHEPRASTLRKLANGLGVDIAELFEEPTIRPLAEALVSPEAVEEQRALFGMCSAVLEELNGRFGPYLDSLPNELSPDEYQRNAYFIKEILSATAAVL